MIMTKMIITMIMTKFAKLIMTTKTEFAKYKNSKMKMAI